MPWKPPQKLACELIAADDFEGGERGGLEAFIHGIYLNITKNVVVGILDHPLYHGSLMTAGTFNMPTLYQ